jgi:ketosteroid isomerase-like protein
MVCATAGRRPARLLPNARSERQTWVLSNNSRYWSAMTKACLALAITTWPSFAADPPYAGSAEDRAALQRTGEAIRAAFGRGDVDAIMAYHHPDVIKALSSDKYLVGRESVRKDLVGTFQAYMLRFETNTIENTLFQGDTAVEESLFSIKGRPKREGIEPFEFKGRSLVVYVRDGRSPTGWASIREIIQSSR